MTKRKSRRFLVIPDCHIPWHDRAAYELMLRVARDWQPDDIVLLGDYGDFFSVNKYGPVEGINITLAQELDCINLELDRLSHLFPAAQKYYIEGNHENRVTRYIANKPELYGAIDTYSALKMHRRINWQWLRYHPDQLLQLNRSYLYLRHEPYKKGANAAKQSALHGGVSLVAGHTHQIQDAQVSNARGDQHRVAIAGWLGNYRAPVFEYREGHNQWALGFATGITSSSRMFHLDQHRIVTTGDNRQYECYFHGKIYRCKIHS